MLKHLESVGKRFHNATKYSPTSVMIDRNCVDASTQPIAFKSYPRFYRRFPLEENHPIHNFIHLTSAITFTERYEDNAYHVRVNPSVGALYPTEIYVQIRGVEGFTDGIYHLEIATNSLTLIYELSDDGLESYILPNCLVKGLIFLVSCAYYRSSWKYKQRSLRYCFLDSGHHLGAIEGAAYLYRQPLQVIFDFDKVSLNIDLGFENKEFVTASVIAGEIEPKSVYNLRSPLPFVAPTDYFKANPFIESGYKSTLLAKFESGLFWDQHLIPQLPPFDFPSEQFLQTILTTRLARGFNRKTISQAEWEQIWSCIKQSLPTVSKEQIVVYSIVNRVEGMPSGLYRELQLHKSGDLCEIAKNLCINKAIAKDSAVTLFLTSTYKNYQTAMQLAGWVGHRLCLISNYLGISCSGIGAYYDNETQEFLGTQQDILYALAIGR